MFKKILLLSSVLFGLLFGMTEECFAGVSAQLQEAEACKEGGYYEDAEDIYKTIVADYPGTDYALKAQVNLVILYIGTGNDANAQSALAKLTADFSEHPALPEALLYNVAREYAWIAGKYEEAKSISQQVIQQYPGTPYARKAQMAIPLIDILSLIDSGGDVAAQSAIDKLITDFNNHPDLPEVLSHIADRYRDLEKYEKAESICKHIIQNYPDTDYVLPAQRDLALWYISVGRDDEAQTAIDSLITYFGYHPGLPEVLHSVAGRYERAGKYEKAKRIYQQIILLYPGSTYAGKAQIAIPMIDVSSLIKSGEDSEALTVLDSLIADFNDHPHLAEVIFVIGEQYYNKAMQMQTQGHDEQAKDYFQKTIAVWERVIQGLPPSTFSPWAYYFSGYCYSRLGKYEKPIEYYQKVADDWPDYQYASEALFLVGRNYENLEKRRVISESEAGPKIKAAYEQLIERYPDHKAVEYARGWLSRHDSK